LKPFGCTLSQLKLHLFLKLIFLFPEEFHLGGLFFIVEPWSKFSDLNWGFKVNGLVISWLILFTLNILILFELGRNIELGFDMLGQFGLKFLNTYYHRLDIAKQNNFFLVRIGIEKVASLLQYEVVKSNQNVNEFPLVSVFGICNVHDTLYCVELFSIGLNLLTVTNVSFN
jgi:hypothetical protein